MVIVYRQYVSHLVVRHHNVGLLVVFISSQIESLVRWRPGSSVRFPYQANIGIMNWFVCSLSGYLLFVYVHIFKLMQVCTSVSGSHNTLCHRNLGPESVRDLLPVIYLFLGAILQVRQFAVTTLLTHVSKWVLEVILPPGPRLTQTLQFAHSSIILRTKR